MATRTPDMSSLARTIPAPMVEHREAFRNYVLESAESWHREHLGRAVRPVGQVEQGLFRWTVGRPVHPAQRAQQPPATRGLLRGVRLRWTVANSHSPVPASWDTPSGSEVEGRCRAVSPCRGRAAARDGSPVAAGGIEADRRQLPRARTGVPRQVQRVGRPPGAASRPMLQGPWCRQGSTLLLALAAHTSPVRLLRRRLWARWKTPRCPVGLGALAIGKTANKSSCWPRRPCWTWKRGDSMTWNYP